MALKIETKQLTSFLKKARMEGSQLLLEAIFKFGDDGLRIVATSATNTSMIRGWLKPSAFIEYEAIGIVPMNDLTTVTKVLSTFGDEVKLKKEGNLLTVSGKTATSNKSVGIELLDEKTFDPEKPEPKLEFTETFKTDALALKNIFSDVKLNKNVTITITSEDKNVLVTNSGKYKFKHNIEAPDCKGGVKVKMGAPLMDVITNLDGELEMFIKSDYPMKITEISEHSEFLIIVAPMADE